MLANLEALKRQLEITRAAIRDTAEEAAREAGEERLERAKAACPVDTGTLRESIALETDGCRARVRTDCPYAAAVEMRTPFLRG